MLEKLGDATMFVGQKMAPVVKTQANKYLPDRFQVGGGEEKDPNKITATDKVAIDSSSFIDLVIVSS